MNADLVLTVKDFMYLAILILTSSGVYWRLVMRISKVEGDNKEFKANVDKLLSSVEEIKISQVEHIAYHRGKESHE